MRQGAAAKSVNAARWLDMPFTTAEVSTAMREMGNSKAAHEDGIPDELIMSKFGRVVMAELT